MAHNENRYRKKIRVVMGLSMKVFVMKALSTMNITIKKKGAMTALSIKITIKKSGERSEITFLSMGQQKYF